VAAFVVLSEQERQEWFCPGIRKHSGGRDAPRGYAAKTGIAVS